MVGRVAGGCGFSGITRIFVLALQLLADRRDTSTHYPERDVGVGWGGGYERLDGQKDR